MTRNPSKLSLIATLAYVLVGTGWIVIGFFISSTIDDGGETSLFELYKGLAFIAVTGGTLFLVLRWMDSGPAGDGSFGQIAEEFRHSIHISERILRWLPPGLAVIIITLLCLLLLGLAWARENALVAGEQSASALRHAIATQTGSAMHVVDLTLREIAHDLDHGQLADTERELQRRLGDRSSLVRAIWVVDHNGRLIHDSDRNTPGIDFSGRDYFSHHRDNPGSGFLIGSPLRSLTTGTWFVSASRAVRGRDGEFLGVVVAALDAVRFGDYWQMPGLDRDGSIALFRDDGILLMRSPHADGDIGKSFMHTTAWRERVPREEAGVYRATSSIDRTARIFGFGRVPGYPELLVFVGISEQQLLSAWRRLAAISIGSLLIIIGVVVALAYILLRQLRLRIQSQKKAAELARYPLQNRNPVLSVSHSGEWLFMNEAARQLLQSTRGTPDAQQLDAAIQSIAAEIGPGGREFVVGTRTYSASYNPHADYCDIYLMDITAQRQGEGLLQLFFDLPFIGMATFSPETRSWLRCNNRLCEILGLSREQLLLKTWPELTHPDDLAEDLANFDRVMRDEAEGYAMEKRFLRPDGTTVHVAMDARAVRRTDRSIELVICTVQDITERKLRELQLRQQRNLYAALSAANEAIIRLRDRDALFSRTCRIAVEEAGFAFAWVGLLDPATGKVNPVARHGEDSGYINRLQVTSDSQRPEGRGATGLVIREGKHHIVNDIQAAPYMQPWHEAATEAGVHASASFPILQGDRVIGTLNLYARQPDCFDAEIVHLLDEMAAGLSHALDTLENERLRADAMAALKVAEERWQFALEGGEHGVWEWNMQTDEVFFSRQWKATLGYTETEIGNTLDAWKSRVHPEDLPEVMRQIELHLGGKTPIYVSEHRMLHQNGAYIWILDRGKLTTRTADGKPLMMIGTHTDVTARREADARLRESEAKFKGLVEQTIVGIAIVDGESMLYANPRTAEILGYAPDEILDTGLPLLIHPEDWPVVERKIGSVLSGKTADIRHEFRALRKDGSIVHLGAHGSRAEYAGRAVVISVVQDITERLQNEQQLADYVAQLERSIMRTVEAISQMVEMRDPYTSGHERRVGDLAAAIGQELGFDEHRITGLRIAGTVHDVGKITIPAEILSKPGKLMAAEYEIVKTHAEKGYEILKNIDFPWPIAKIVLQHHERLDGSGYPQGLKDGDIMMEARILAIADVVESMGTHRPYRPALGLEAALKEILAHSGSLYDAQVVAVTLRLFRERGYRLPE
ncbi:MAG: PAS domain S-box protein [Burkholderiales bacterium]|nr:PAS domain S-box protein [Burkholderiales bacterium]